MNGSMEGCMGSVVVVCGFKGLWLLFYLLLFLKLFFSPFRAVGVTSIWNMQVYMYTHA